MSFKDPFAKKASRVIDRAPLAISSASDFYSWLCRNIISELPLGISSRLQLLHVDRVSQGLLLRRPHLLHIVEKVAQVLDQWDSGAAYAQLLGAAHAGREGDAIFLRVFRQLWSLTLYGRGGSAMRSGRVQTDGEGRMALLYTSLLGNCAVWWDGRGVGHSIDLSPGGGRHYVSTTVLGPLGFRVGFPTGGMVSDAQQSIDRLALLRVLRRLVMDGGWQIPLGFSQLCSCSDDCELRFGSGAPGCIDHWLYAVVRGAIAECDLGSRAITGCSGKLHFQGQSSGEISEEDWQLLARATRSILATEVEKKLCTSLYHLFLQFIRYPCDPAPGVQPVKYGEQPSPPCSSLPSLNVLRRRLTMLATHPHSAFLCSLTHSCRKNPTQFSGVSSNTGGVNAAPPLVGVVEGSRIVPSYLGVLPLIERWEGGAAPPLLDNTTIPTPYFAIRGSSVYRQRTTVASQWDCQIQRLAIGVLLLRVDPAGDWLPYAMTAFNERSFFASYCADGPCGGPPVSDETDFSVVEARGRGWQHVGTLPFTTGIKVLSEEDSSLQAEEADKQGQRSHEGSLLDDVAEKLRLFSPVINDMLTCAAEGQLLINQATLRLFIYAVLHGARVVISPERLPTVLKVFGTHAISSLYTSLKSFALSRDSSVAARWVRQQLDGPPPVAVYVVDGVHQDAFSSLQASAALWCRSASHPSRYHRVLPVTLCRGALRYPFSCSPSSPQPSPPSPLWFSCSNAGCGGRGQAEVATSSNIADSAGAAGSPGMCGASFCCVTSAAMVEKLRGRSAEEIAASLETLPEVRGEGTICFVVLAPLQQCEMDVAGVETTDINEVAGLWHGDEENSFNDPRLLLVSPTEGQSAYYEGLLRKVALELLDALPSNTSPRRYQDVAGRQWTSAISVMAPPLDGFVYGGGFFYLTVARQLYLLSVALNAESSAMAAARSVASDVEETSQSLPRLFTSGLSSVDTKVVLYVLHLLIDACVAVAYHHQSSRASCMRVDVDSHGKGPAWEQHRDTPHGAMLRAKEVLLSKRGALEWMEAVREVVVGGVKWSKSPFDIPITSETSFVYVNQCDLSDRQEMERHRLASLGLPPLPLETVALTQRLGARDYQDGSVTSSEAIVPQAPTNSPFPEPAAVDAVHTNVRALDESLRLLLRTLEATIPVSGGTLS